MSGNNIKKKVASQRKFRAPKPTSGIPRQNTVVIKHISELETLQQMNVAFQYVVNDKSSEFNKSRINHVCNQSFLKPRIEDEPVCVSYSYEFVVSASHEEEERIVVEIYKDDQGLDCLSITLRSKYFEDYGVHYQNINRFIIEENEAKFNEIIKTYYGIHRTMVSNRIITRGLITDEDRFKEEMISKHLPEMSRLMLSLNMMPLYKPK